MNEETVCSARTGDNRSPRHSLRCGEEHIRNGKSYTKKGRFGSQAKGRQISGLRTLPHSPCISDAAEPAAYYVCPARNFLHMYATVSPLSKTWNPNLP